MSLNSRCSRYSRANNFLKDSRWQLLSAWLVVQMQSTVGTRSRAGGHHRGPWRSGKPSGNKPGPLRDVGLRRKENKEMLSQKGELCQQRWSRVWICRLIYGRDSLTLVEWVSKEASAGPRILRTRQPRGPSQRDCQFCRCKNITLPINVNAVSYHLIIFQIEI